MSFTRYLPRLDREHYPEEAFLAEIGKALRAHLHRMGLWDQPPAFLGYSHLPTWHDAFAGGDAAADPTLDCYLEAVVRRYDSLMDHLLHRKANIDGLVHLNIKRFILKRQKAHDPVGYAVFKNLEAALAGMHAAGQVHVPHSDPKEQVRFRNATLLTFTPGAPASPAPPETIEAALEGDPRWEQALPRLSKIGRGAQDLLGQCLAGLPGRGVPAFRLGDLVGPLKDRARAVHVRRHLTSEPDVITPVQGDDRVREIIRTVQPVGGYEGNRESLEGLFECLEDRIDSLLCQERTREGLRRIVQELRQRAESDEEIPTWAELARQLGARRQTIWDHLQRLRPLVLECQGEA